MLDLPIKPLSGANPEAIVERAAEAFREKQGWPGLLDGVDVPAYATDAHGAVTYWNQACVDFAGRQPRIGEDRWCVTWKLYTLSGDHLPHDKCPMAKAIRTALPVRHEIAVAMRPDGSRRAFNPYATPLFDGQGKLAGAVNVLIDVTHEQAAALDDQASRCRRLLQSTTDPDASRVLQSMAEGYADTARSLRSSSQA